MCSIFDQGVETRMPYSAFMLLTINPDDLTFIELAKLQLNGMSRETYETIKTILRHFGEEP
jgi:hypothetical protein